MDKREASEILARKLKEYSRTSYHELAARVDAVDDVEIAGDSGIRYGVEINFIWDSRPGGPVRVIGSIDDGGWHSMFPLTDDFIKAPDGSFVDELAT